MRPPWVTEVSITRRSSARPSLTHLLVLCRHVNVYLLPLMSGTCSISQVLCSHESERCVVISHPVSCPAQFCAWHIQSVNSNKKVHTDGRNPALRLLWVWSLMVQGLLTWPRDLPLEYSGGTFAFGVREGVLRNRTLQFIKSDFVLCNRLWRHIQRKWLAWGQGKWIVNTGSESLEQYLFGLDFTGCKTC